MLNLPPVPLGRFFILLRIHMKKQKYESPESEILVVEMEYHLLESQLDDVTVDEFEDL